MSEEHGGRGPIERPFTRDPRVSPTDYPVQGEPDARRASESNVAGEPAHDAPLSAGRYVEQNWRKDNPYLPLRIAGQTDSPAPSPGGPQAEGSSTGPQTTSTMGEPIDEGAAMVPKKSAISKGKEKADLYTGEESSAKAQMASTEELTASEASLPHEQNEGCKGKETADSDPAESFSTRAQTFSVEGYTEEEAFRIPERSAVSKGKDKMDVMEESSSEGVGMTPKESTLDKEEGGEDLDPAEDSSTRVQTLLVGGYPEEEAFSISKYSAVSKGKEKVDIVEESSYEEVVSAPKESVLGKGNGRADFNPDEGPSAVAQTASVKPSANEGAPWPPQTKCSRLPRDPPSYRTEHHTPSGPSSGDVDAIPGVTAPAATIIAPVEQEPAAVPVLDAYKDIRCPDYDDSRGYALVRGTRVICIGDTQFTESEPDNNLMFQMRSGDAYILLKLYGDLWASCIRLTIRNPIQPTFPETMPLAFRGVTWPAAYECIGFLPLCSLTMEANYSDYVASDYKVTGLTNIISPMTGQAVKAPPRTFSRPVERMGRPGSYGSIVVPIDLFERANFHLMSKHRVFEPERAGSTPPIGHTPYRKAHNYKLGWRDPSIALTAAQAAKKALWSITGKRNKADKYGRYTPTVGTSVESTLGRHIDSRGSHEHLPAYHGGMASSVESYHQTGDTQQSETNQQTETAQQTEPNQQMETIQQREPIQGMETTPQTEPNQQTETTQQTETAQQTETIQQTEPNQQTEATQQAEPSRQTDITPQTEPNQQMASTPQTEPNQPIGPASQQGQRRKGTEMRSWVKRRGSQLLQHSWFK